MENVTSDPIRDQQPLAVVRHPGCLVSNGASQQKISKRIAEIPKPYRKDYEKAVTGGSKPAAIKAFCLECVCWQKNEIINCTAITCPLYSVRPFVGRKIRISKS